MNITQLAVIYDFNNTNTDSYMGFPFIVVNKAIKNTLITQDKIICNDITCEFDKSIESVLILKEDSMAINAIAIRYDGMVLDMYFSMIGIVSEEIDNIKKYNTREDIFIEIMKTFKYADRVKLDKKLAIKINLICEHRDTAISIKRTPNIVLLMYMIRLKIESKK